VRLLVLGPPGAGKGTQSKRVATEYGIAHLSTGDMFRAEIEAQTDVGRRVGPILDAGDLVPDELTIELLRQHLTGAAGKRGFVLDGFPRNDAQADALDELLRMLDLELDAILYFDLPDHVAIQRMLGRASKEGRSDDVPDTIARRFEVYRTDTEPVIEHYRVTGKLVPLHAERSTDEVWVEVQQALDQVGARA
jgi:adenylate kinase